MQVTQVMNDIAENSWFVTLWNSPGWKAQAESRRSGHDSEALEYLRAKFPGVDDRVFHTDRNGVISEHVIEAFTVCQASRIEKACTSCKDGKCTLPEAFRSRRSRPVVMVKTSPRGCKFLSVGWTCGITCRFDPLSGEFGRMFRASGLVPPQLHKTFETYQRNGSESVNAKSKAMKAAMNQSCLILAGKRGTGKTHLATAIALDAMNHGRQAIFRFVNELLDEIRQAFRDSEDAYGLIQKFKDVPCLVLDDLGKEKTTDAGLDYLYQIVDYRYKRELQTIITTNAKTINELATWYEEKYRAYVTPICSRLMERGAWVTIEHAEDFRVKGGER